jgi:sulfur relay (sulfurtransferase) DsrC/TusE family protein
MALNFNKIKGLFVIPEEEMEGYEKKQEVKKTEEKKTVHEKKSSVETNTVKSESPDPPSKGELNEQIFNSLTKAISDANLPGEDYLEFVSALQAMKSIELAESVKMQTVLATLSIKGLTVQKIIESADYYLKVLENEKDKFRQAMAQQTTGKVEEKHKEIRHLEEANIKMSEQIKMLTDEITNNTAQIEKIKHDITEADSKIKTTENNFNVTFDYVANQIINNVDKIKNLSN